MPDSERAGSSSLNDGAPSAGDAAAPRALRRQIGVGGATMLGLGSILGTGIFVSIGIAAGAGGPSVVLATAVAAAVAACNGLSSAQLAANHPVSGGSYEYGYRWLHPSLGFTAGWMFLCAKSASAATAALGLAGYTLSALRQSGSSWLIPLAVGSVAVLTLLVLTGIRRSSNVNMAIVSVTIVSLLLFVVTGLPTAIHQGTENLQPFFTGSSAGGSPVGGFLEACALMFVAFTGYGRIATLGEEIHHPRRNIPVAIVATLLVSAALYLAVSGVAIAAAGSAALATATVDGAAPLVQVTRMFNAPAVTTLVAVGAVTAMLGVLLNLLLGLSRVALAMGRRGDLPRGLARIDRAGATPYVATLAVGLAIAVLTLIGNVKTTWSFSAFTVLIYYALTNLAATRLTDQQRLYPRWIPWAGLAACGFLAFWVEPAVWMVGLALIAGGLVWQQGMQRVGQRGTE